MSDFEFTPDPVAPPVAPQVPSADSATTYATDQRRGGMGGIIEVPMQQQAPDDYEFVRDSDTGKESLQETQHPAYNPDVMFAAYPPAAREAMSNITDAGIGAWHHLAEFTGIPLGSLLNASNEVAKSWGPVFGKSDKGFLPNYGWTSEDATRFVQKTMAKAGIDSDPRDAYSRWAADMGHSAADMATQAMLFMTGAGGAAKAGDAIVSRAPSEAASAATVNAARMSPDVTALPAALAGKAGSDLVNAAGSTMKNVGENAILHPGQVAASYVGAGVGSTAGGALGQNKSFQNLLSSLGIEASPEMMSTLGSIAGGMFGSSVGSMKRIHPDNATDTELTQGGYRGMAKSGGAQVRGLMPNATTLLNAQREFSGEDVANAVNGYTAHVTNWLKNTAANVVGLKANPDGTMPTLPSTAAQAERMKTMAMDGYNRAQQIADNVFWGPLDKTPRATIPTSLQTAGELAGSETSPTAIAANIPMNYIHDIQSLGLGPKGVQKMPNIGQMQSLLTTMRREITALGIQGDPRTRTMRANLTKLANSLDTDMGNAAPDSAALAQARSYSNWMHQTFSNGPLGTFTNAMNSQPLAQINPKDALNTAMADYRFGQQLAGTTPEQMAAGAGVTGMSGPGGMPSMGDLGMPVQPRTGDWLKSMVVDSFNQKLDPSLGGDVEGLTNAASAATAMQRYMKSEDFQNLVKNFPQLDAEMNGHMDDIQHALTEGMAIKKSIFFKNAGMQPETAVDSLFSSGSKVRDAQKIVNQFGDNPEVMESLQYGLIKRLGNTTNWDPDQMITALNSKDNRVMFQKLMPDGGFERLNRILNAGSELKAGKTVEGGSMFGKWNPMVVGGRVVGSLLTGLMGGHSIQVHSIGTQLGGNIMQRFFHIVPPEYMIQKAMVDPRWERFLNSKLPTTMAGIKATNRMMGALVGATYAGNRRLMEPEGDNSGQP